MQHYGPINSMVPENVLSDHLDIGRPELFEFSNSFKRGRVVHKSVKPYIHHIILIKRKLHAPRRSFFWTRYTKIHELLS